MYQQCTSEPAVLTSLLPLLRHRWRRHGILHRRPFGVQQPEGLATVEL